MIKVYMRAFQFKVTALEMAHYQTNTHVIDPGTMSKKDYCEGHGCCNVSFAFLLWICTFLKAKHILFCKLSAGKLNC